MKKTMLALTMILAAGFAAAATELYAGPGAGTKLAAPAQELTIKGKKPARFNHGKHLGLGLDCGSCHHDAKHQPLGEKAIAALGKAEALSCVGCHNDNFANEKLRQPMAVFHARCKDCHAAGLNGKQGPTSCAACHAPAQKTVTPAVTPKPAPAVAPAPPAAPAAPVAPAPAAPAVKKPKAIEGC